MGRSSAPIFIGGAVTKQELIEHLRQLVEEAGSQRELAKRLGVSAPFIGDVLLGKREPAPKMLKALGLRRVVTFERLDNGECQA